jgi:hypothetical protein
MNKECITKTKDFIDGVYREFVEIVKDEDIDYRSGASAFRRELILALAREEKKGGEQKDKDKKKHFTSDDHSVKTFLGDSTNEFRKILNEGKL